MMAPLTINPDVATFINVFTVEPFRQNVLVNRIKFDAETTICKQAGFIRAIVHRSLDGSKVVNLVQWESVEASRAIHHNPDIAASFASYQELGVRMDLRYYETALMTAQPFTIQTHDGLMAQIDVLQVAPDDPQLLLEYARQHSNPAIASADDRSTVWFRSLDGIRVIRFSYSQGSNHNENTQVFATENWIEQVTSHCYQVEFVITKQSLLV
ncbi:MULTISPECIES: antibiotic biosynthesis monooxygenase family protein [Nostocales]|uniref:ABM domain-containing protein n=3 Tax=Nostocales TaxID=1161 RepID=A0A8S9SX38_9CYAN|nr:antibiotic biosynthesis monooxygenase [Tolypothrix bouteillei]KAF3884931.1 hypothetical protein DA73_0400005255 [Tolypothrix bouteillei VB521301]